MARLALLSALSESLGYLPLLLILAASLYMIYGAIYRLYLCPVAKFPGPRFAALTFWNEFYYDVWLGGRSTVRQFLESSSYVWGVVKHALGVSRVSALNILWSHVFLLQSLVQTKQY